MRAKLIIIPGFSLGIIHSIFGLFCFAVSRQYPELNICGFDGFYLQQWMFTAGIIYYIEGLLISLSCAIIDYEINLKCIYRFWFTIITLEVLFTCSWSLLGIVRILIWNCDKVPYPLWITAVVTITFVPVFSIMLSCIVCYGAVKYREQCREN